MERTIYRRWKEVLNGNNKEYKDETSDLKRIIAELTIINIALKKHLK
ncbi:hypothetical protein [Acidiplasma aeolicum]|jgi:hypothetical protein